MTKTETNVTRKCVYTNQILPVSQLLRFNKNQANNIEIDWNNSLKGRGAYIIKNKDKILEALKRKILHKAFRMNVPQEVYTKVTKEVEEYGW
ncbi:Putative transciprtional termination factor [Mycoplasmopsis californica]|uniref:YlxR family protein n=1 Tax=Mycoplasmopsis equigenitalium TaxID=114883 RepID=A0ABY5J0D9_9BACT|nr:YlxR family protein [Mycoplasmopsis equigenitalium]UUD36721.1 YlxR family protein [Mycoplasmopsis equigenitalium]VEU69985.1 Putative transciprtional termination factor [Mycoplasmopsis californica]